MIARDTNISRFKAGVRKGVAMPRDTLLHKAASVTVSSITGERRKLFTISTPRVDRDNDTIAVSGWDLTAYRLNPIVLFEHNAYAPPIGKSVEIGIDGDQLRAVVEFVPADMPLVGDQAEMVFRMCDLGFLSAASVGFRPIEYKINHDRTDDDDWNPALDFSKQELMEWSIVTVPSNVDAVIDLTELAAEVEVAKAAEGARIARAAEIEAQRRRMRAACY